jgi:nucleotide-binding universal stress UspA family protein
MSRITLLRVINLALYAGKSREGIDPFDEAREILDKAKAFLMEADISESLIATKIRMGKPSEEILQESKEEDYNIIIMGRKGRTALKDLVLGGVSTTILHRIQNPTVAIVSTR